MNYAEQRAFFEKRLNEVSKGLKEDAKPQPYEPSKYNLICVYDMAKQGYRMLNINTLLTLSVNKNTYTIE